jgi:hypothetical protein
VERRTLVYETCTSSRAAGDDSGNSGDEIFWRLREQHPVCAYQDRTLDFSARKISDFLSRRRLHRLELYTDLHRPFGVEDVLAVGFSSTLRHSRSFLFNSQGRDFDERDRTLLNTLRPHFLALYAAAAARRVAAAIAAGNGASRAIVVISRSGAIDFETAAAGKLLTRYFDDAHDARVPEMIGSWLREQRTRLNGNGSLPGPCAAAHRPTRRRATGHPPRRSQPPP